MQPNEGTLVVAPLVEILADLRDPPFPFEKLRLPILEAEALLVERLETALIDEEHRRRVKAAGSITVSPEQGRQRVGVRTRSLQQQGPHELPRQERGHR